MQSTTTTSTILEITLNGFHGYETHRVRGTKTPTTGFVWGYECSGYQIEISPSGAKKFGCGMRDCTCGEGLPTSFFVAEEDCEGKSISIKGNYPQR
jgi:hypothetical protein